MQIEASHILVESKEQAENLRSQILQGQEFASVASQFSRCPSRSAGGNLGAFGRGQMVPEFEEAAFNLPVGSVSQPVQTQFGWHLIHRTS